MPFNHGKNQVIEHARVNKASQGSNIVVINIERKSASHDDLGIPNANGNGIFHPTEQDYPSLLEKTITSSPTTSFKSNNPFHPSYRTCEGPPEYCDAETSQESETLRRVRPLRAKTSVDVATPAIWGLTGAVVEERAYTSAVFTRKAESRVSVISTADPTFAPGEEINRSNNSCKIYIEHMLRQRHGFPLWLPQPDLFLPVEYREEGVNIGDVGIITNNGGFDFLFNVWLPRHSLVNPSDLPEHLYLHTRPEKLTSRQHLFDPCSALCSGASKFNTKWVTRECSFECTGYEGAILCLPDGSFVEDLRNERHMENFIIQNAESWYAYANGRAGRAVERNSLYLITSCMKASSWGIATYGSVMPERYNVLKFAKAIDPGRKYMWEESGSAIARTGPPPDPGLSTEIERQNQCLFVQGFKIGLSEEAWISASRSVPLSTEVGDQQNSAYSNTSGRVNGNGKSNGSSSSSNDHYSGQGGSSSVGLSRTINVEQFPSKIKIFHPSDIINKFLLEEHPKARVALTHDKDWIALLEEGETLLPSAHTILRRVKIAFKIDTVLNGKAVCLRKSSEERYHDIEDVIPFTYPMDGFDTYEFSVYTQGIVSGSDIDEVQEFIGTTNMQVTTADHSTSNNTDSFVRNVFEWNKNELDMRTWTFSSNTDQRNSVVVGHLKTENKPGSTIRALLTFAWMQVIISRMFRRKEEPIPMEFELVRTEVWENELTGRFRMKRRKITPTASGYIPQQCIELIHERVSEYEYPIQRRIAIHKNIANCFSIHRQYSDIDASAHHDNESETGRNGEISHVALLAPRNMQVQASSLASVPVEYQLESHGLLEEDDHQSIWSSIGENLSSIQSRLDRKGKGKGKGWNFMKRISRQSSVDTVISFAPRMASLSSLDHIEMRKDVLMERNHEDRKDKFKERDHKNGKGTSTSVAGGSVTLLDVSTSSAVEQPSSDTDDQQARGRSDPDGDGKTHREALSTLSEDISYDTSSLQSVSPRKFRTTHREALGTLPEGVLRRPRQNDSNQLRNTNTGLRRRKWRNNNQASVPSSYSRTLIDPISAAYTPGWLAGPLPLMCEAGRPSNNKTMRSALRSMKANLPKISGFLTLQTRNMHIQRMAPSESMTSIGPMPTERNGESTGASILMGIPRDTPYMLLPLWPGKTDLVSSSTHPFHAPNVPHKDRLYLFVWYTPDLPPLFNESARKKKWWNKLRRSKGMNSSTKKLNDGETAHDSEPNLFSDHFHFSARVIAYPELLGTGVCLPQEGLEVFGPLEEAFKAVPVHYKNIYPGVQLGQYFGRGSSGFMFNDEAFEVLDLCRPTNGKGKLKMKEEEEELEEHVPGILTPIGRVVLEMAWAGGMALTSFE